MQISKRLATLQVRWLPVGTAVGLSVGLLGSIAYAAIPGTGGVISGCVTKDNIKGQHVLTLLDTAQSTVCRAGQTLITWNQTGPVGPQGPQGASGATGPQGPAGPSDAFATTGNSTLLDGRDGGGWTDLAKLALPAGKYLAFAQATIRNTNTGLDFVICRLSDGGVY